MQKYSVTPDQNWKGDPTQLAPPVHGQVYDLRMLSTSQSFQTFLKHNVVNPVCLSLIYTNKILHGDFLQSLDPKSGAKKDEQDIFTLEQTV